MSKLNFVIHCNPLLFTTYRHGDVMGHEMPRPCGAVRDGALAIANAIEEEWPGVAQVNCWAHIIRNVDKHLPNLPKGLSKEDKREFLKQKRILRSDITLLQLAPNEKTFQISNNCFQ